MTVIPKGSVEFYLVAEYSPHWIFWRGPDGRMGYLAGKQVAKASLGTLTVWSAWWGRPKTPISWDYAEREAAPEAWAKLLLMYPEALDPLQDLLTGEPDDC